MKKMIVAMPLLAAALSIAACAKHDDVANSTVEENTTLTESEVPADNFTVGNVVVPEESTPDNGIAGNLADAPANAQ